MDSLIEKYKEKLLDLLVAFDKFCTDNNLKYYASGGTAIGVVRHKGFIPWDDDIDVVMPREDYNRMIELRNTLNPKKYYIKTLGDEDYIYAYGKFCDAQTTLVEYKIYPRCIIGVNIDIFPIDEVLDDRETLCIKRRKFYSLRERFLMTYQKLSMRNLLSYLKHGEIKKAFESLYYGVLSSNLKKKKTRDLFIAFEKKWQLDKGVFLYNHSAFYPLEKELLSKDWFSDFVYMPFENTKIRMMKGYNQYLSQLFGDYMTPPPLDKQVSQHSHYYINLKERLSRNEIEVRMASDEYSVF